MTSRTLHPFPARMAPDIALDTIRARASAKPVTVLDPMCGSGTVLSIALAEGHHAVGLDVDPLAVLMSNVAVRGVDEAALSEEAARVVHRAKQLRSQTLHWNDQETQDFAEYWFGHRQRVALARLSRAIGEVESSSMRDALSVAMSRTIITKSPCASLAADTSHSRPHKVLETSDYDVLDGFARSATQMGRLLAGRAKDRPSPARLGDARAMSVGTSTIDLVVTSPPYLNAIDYLRGHRLALIWLGYTLKQLRAIRSNSIGAERAPYAAIAPQTAALVDAVESLVDDPSVFPRRIVERYALDLSLFASELFRVCRPSSQVVVVIGNSTLRGNFIRNDLLVGKALRGAGFELKPSRTRELPEAKRYLPVRSANPESALTKRMRTEVVMTAGKLHD